MRMPQQFTFDIMGGQMRSRILGSVVLARCAGLILPPLALLSACSSRTGSDETIGTSGAAVMGTDNFGSDCSSSEVTFLQRAAWYGRVAANSPAFDQCLQAAFVTQQTTTNPQNGSTNPIGPYQQCIGDPFFGQGIAVQEPRGLAMATSPNDFQINCTGGNAGGNASAGIGTYFTSAPEALAFTSWLPGVLPANNPVIAWPTRQAAAILWHEASHQHGYVHGAEDQADAIGACGYAGSSTWNFQVNTFPYILQGCIDKTILDSATNCGALASCPVSTSLRLVTALDATDCLCVSDPNPEAPRPDDSDVDRDGIPNVADTCPTIPNRTQNDANGVAELQVAINTGFQSQFPNEGTPPTNADSLDYFNHFHHWYLGDACDTDPTTAVDTYTDTDGVNAPCTLLLIDGFGTVVPTNSGTCPRQLTSGLETNSFISNGFESGASAGGTTGPTFCKCLQAESNDPSDLMQCGRTGLGASGCIVANDTTFPPLDGSLAATPSGWRRITQHTSKGTQPFAAISTTFQQFGDDLVGSGTYVAQPVRTLWDFPADLPSFNELPTANILTGTLWAHVLTFAPAAGEKSPRTNFNNNYQGTNVEVKQGSIIRRFPNYKMAPQPWHWAEVNAQTHEIPMWLLPLNGAVYQVSAGHSVDVTNRFSSEGLSLLYQTATPGSGFTLLTDEGVARVGRNTLAAVIVSQDSNGVMSLNAAFQPDSESGFADIEVNTGGSSSAAIPAAKKASTATATPGIAIGHVVAQAYDAERGRLLSLVTDGHAKSVSALDVGNSLANGSASETRVATNAFENPIAFTYVGAMREAFILDRVSERRGDHREPWDRGRREEDDRDCDHRGGDSGAAHLRLLEFGDDLVIHELWSTSSRNDVPTNAFLSPSRYNSLLLTLAWDHESELMVLDNLGNVYASTKVQSRLENRPVIGVGGITLATSTDPHGASTFLDVQTIARPKPQHDDCGAHFLRSYHAGPRCHIKIPTSPADLPNLGD